MRTKLVKIIGAGWLAAALAGDANATLNVVATLPDLAALATEVGGARVQVVSLARPTEDPHYVEPKPSLVVKLSRADCLLEGGAELEQGWLAPLLDRARNPKLAEGSPGRVACNRNVQLLEIPATLDRSQGDLHALGNPHYLVDPLIAKAVAAQIAEAFARLDPAGAEEYQTRLRSFQDRLDRSLVEWRKLLAPYAGRHLAAYHNSWLYFATRFGLKIDIFLEPKPGLPPTPAHLAAVAARMKAERVPVILLDPYLNRRTAEAVAERTGARVVAVAQYPGGLKGTDGDYLKTMDANVRAIAAAFAGQAGTP